MPSVVPYLFVYGSLTRRGDAKARQPLVDGGHFLREASIQGRLYLADGWPAAVPSQDPSERIEGEAYELGNAAETLARLDAWEGSHYQRRLVPVLFKDQGFEIECWAWFWTKAVDESTRIPSGRWKAGQR